MWLWLRFLGSDAHEQMTWSHVGDLALGSWVVGETFYYGFHMKPLACPSACLRKAVGDSTFCAAGQAAAAAAAQAAG